MPGITWKSVPTIIKIIVYTISTFDLIFLEHIVICLIKNYLKISYFKSSNTRSNVFYNYKVN